MAIDNWQFLHRLLKRAINSVLVPIFVVLLPFAATHARAEIIDRILAVVGGEVITLSDVSAAQRLGLVSVPSGTADSVRLVLDALIERQLELGEVNRYLPPEPSRAGIDARLAELDRRVGSALQDVLTQTGLTIDQLRRWIRDDLRIEAYLDQRFGPAAQRGEREKLIRGWIADLRRRAEVNDLYLSGK